MCSWLPKRWMPINIFQEVGVQKFPQGKLAQLWIPPPPPFSKMSASVWSHLNLLLCLYLLLQWLWCEAHSPLASKHWESQYFPNTTSILSPWRQTKRHLFWGPGWFGILTGWKEKAKFGGMLKNTVPAFCPDPGYLEQVFQSSHHWIYFTCILWQKIVSGPVSPGPCSSCSLRSIIPSVNMRRDEEKVAFKIE